MRNNNERWEIRLQSPFQVGQRRKEMQTSGEPIGNPSGYDAGAALPDLGRNAWAAGKDRDDGPAIVSLGWTRKKDGGGRRAR